MKSYWLFLSSLIVLLSGLPAAAANYTVKAGGGGDFTTIQACANAAVAGDTCQVYAGTYSAWTQSTSGNAGSPITFTVHPGDTVTLTSGVTVTNTQYITINGFTFSGSFGRAVFGSDGVGITTSNIIVSNNTVTWTSLSASGGAFYLYGDNDRIENNTVSSGGDDFADLGGKNVVVRGNTFNNPDGSVTAQHIDFIQVVGGGTTPTLSFSLVEHNVESHCKNDGGNCHFIIVRTGTGPVADTVIVRFNFAQNLDGSGASFGGVGDDVPNAHFYQNTMATEQPADPNSAECASYQNAPNGANLNNICYNTQQGGLFPLGGSAPPNNGSIAFTTGYSGSWSAPYSQEATYNALKNQNPIFANYPTDGTLQASSPAIGAGVALTTVAAGDSRTGTSLVVADAHFFQPGWAGTQADWIRVGASTTVQIASINYATNTITLANSITRSLGDSVYLYKDSKGTVVLFGNAPDIGAYQFQGSVPTTPANVSVH